MLKAKVLFSCTANEDNEITTNKGDIVDVITMETEHDGWWLVRYGDQEGLASSNSPSLILPVPMSNIKGMMKKVLISILNYYKHDLKGSV